MQEQRRGLWRSRWAAIGAAVAVALGAGGVSIARAASAGSSSFVPITPCRIIDTRSGAPIGTRSTPLGVAETATFTIWGQNGNCTLPTNATAIAANVTVTSGTAVSFLTIWPADVSRPNTSTNNWAGGQGPTPNKVDVKVSADGKISVYNDAGTANIIVDILGYYEPAPVPTVVSDGVEFNEVSSVITVALTDTVLTSVVVTAPTAGFVVVNASVSVQAPQLEPFYCGISKSTTQDAGSNIVTQPTGAGATSGGVSMTRGFAVPAGNTTFNLLCHKTNASATVSAGSPALTAVYSPNRV
jgi:hypothetical protein